MWTGGCLFSLQQLALLSLPEFLGLVQTLKFMQGFEEPNYKLPISPPKLLWL